MLNKREIEYILSPYIVNDYFKAKFFPSKERIEYVDPKIPYSNNTIYYNIIIYGLPGRGKTTTANSIARMGRDKYGTDNVNTTFSENGDLELLINRGLEPKLINILFTDNATLAKQNKDVISKYFRLRNQFHDRFKLNNGYILSLIALHRIHGVPVDLRSTADAMIIRDISLDKYDSRVIRSYVGNDDLYEVLDEIIELRFDFKELMNYNLFVSRKKVGILKLEPAPEFYFKEPPSLMEAIKKLYGDDVANNYVRYMSGKNGR